MIETANKFDEDMDRAYQGIRGAMTQLLSAVDADPSRPQDISRRFKINKNLAWKVSRMILVPEPHQMIPNIPGHTGIETVLSAFEVKGAPDSVLNAARNAFEDFDEVVRIHLGDRSTLQLALTSGTPEKVSPEHLHATRKMAYQGNSAIWGVQARLRFASFFIAPNADDPSMIDTASVGGLMDVRRLRSNTGIPLFWRFSYNDDGTVRDGPRPQPIDAACPESDELMLMSDFSTVPTPEFQENRLGGVTQYMLRPGPVGNRGLQSWVFGEYVRGFASKYRDEQNEFGEHALPVSVPTEWLMCDLQVHKDFAFAFEPKVYAHAFFSGDSTKVTESELTQLPLSETVQSIGSNPPVVATPLLMEYPKIVDCVYERLGWVGKDFVGYRFLMKYPPLHAHMIMQHGLCDRTES
jgi:hypothetical protein